MTKYFLAFKLAFAKQLAYRMNFFMGRVRNILMLLLLYYLWFTVTDKASSFAGYSQQELLTYVFGVHILVAFIFAWQTRNVARQINSGELSGDLLKPIPHVLYVYVMEFSERLLFLVAAIIEAIVAAWILDVTLLAQTDLLLLMLFALSVFFAHILYFLLSYLFSLVAFWTREAMGPRFLFEWILEFASGRFFPLSIVGAGWLLAFKTFPFMYIVFVPMEIYLGRIVGGDLLQAFALQLVWIGTVGLLCTIAWRRGLQRYSGEGI